MEDILLTKKLNSDFSELTLTGEPLTYIGFNVSGDVAKLRVNRSIAFDLTDLGGVIETGQKLIGIPIPSDLNGFSVVDVLATQTTGNTGSTTIQLKRKRSGAVVNVLSTGITINATDHYSSNETIDLNNDDVATGDVIWPEVTANSSNATNLQVVVTLQR